MIARNPYVWMAIGFFCTAISRCVYRPPLADPFHLVSPEPTIGL